MNEEEAIKYRGRTFGIDEIKQIREVIESNPGKSRYFISHELCRQWGWTQANGALKDMVCRGLLNKLERAGIIVLPARRNHPPNYFLNRKKPTIIEIEQSTFSGVLSEIKPLEFIQVRGTSQEKLYNSLIEQHHYLGYSTHVGEQIKYIVYAQKRAVACMGWCSAPRHIGCRDRYIGWDQEKRRKNIALMATNTRFLILPWIKVPHLASHLLGICARRIGQDWKQRYNHEVVFLETFVDPARGFRGTCYKAANWIYLGLTTGRGKDDQSNRVNRSLKYVFVYPLRRDFRELLHG